jgi:hypothetical protein
MDAIGLSRLLLRRERSLGAPPVTEIDYLSNRRKEGVGCRLSSGFLMYEDELPDSFATRVKSCSLRRSRCSLERDEPADLFSEKGPPQWSWRCEALDGRGAGATDHDEIRGMGRVRSRRRIAAKTQASYTWCFLLRPMPMTTPRGDLVGQVLPQIQRRRFCSALSGPDIAGKTGLFSVKPSSGQSRICGSAPDKPPRDSPRARRCSTTAS